MKQSAKNFGRNSKNQPNFKEGPPTHAWKIIEPKEKLSECSEGASGQNEDEHENSGFSRPKPCSQANTLIKASDSSCFSKVNLIKANGGIRTHNKENHRLNEGWGNSSDNSKDVLQEEDYGNPSEVQKEKRIARFLSEFSKKLKSYVKEKGDIDDPQLTKKKTEEYLRGLDDEALDRFLREKEKDYSSEQYNREGSQNLEENVHVEEDLKSLFSTCEIPQEEIIQMTNMSNLLSSETTCSLAISESLKVNPVQHSAQYFACYVILF